MHHNGRPWTAVYNNALALVTVFLAYNVGIDWREEFMYGRTVKLNGQGKMLACMLAMDRHWWWTCKYTFIDVQ